MPSRLKLGVRCVLDELGDFSAWLTAFSCGDGISMVNPSPRACRGNGLGLDAVVVAAAVAELCPFISDDGESPVEDGDMF